LFFDEKQRKRMEVWERDLVLKYVKVLFMKKMCVNKSMEGSCVYGFWECMSSCGRCAKIPHTIVYFKLSWNLELFYISMPLIVASLLLCRGGKPGLGRNECCCQILFTAQAKFLCGNTQHYAK
jgi:hypothetical protein